MSDLRILHLYADELGINGDRGNVIALARRLEWRGLAAEVIEVGAGGVVPSEVDLVHIGTGPRSARDVILAGSASHGRALREWAEAGVPILAIGAGFHLLCAQLATADGSTREGFGVLPVEVRNAPHRVVSEVLGRPRGSSRIAGFVNHGAVVERAGLEPFVELERGPGDGGATATQPADGVRHGSVIATHLSGPLLPMNPSIADELLSAALERKGRSLSPSDDRTVQVDAWARNARAAIATRLGRAGVAV